MERELKEARKAFDQNDDQVAKDAGKKGAAAVAAASGGGGGGGGQEDGGDGGGGENAAPPSVSGTAGKKSKGKGKRTARRESDATEESVPKKRKTIG